VRHKAYNKETFESMLYNPFSWLIVSLFVACVLIALPLTSEGSNDLLETIRYTVLTDLQQRTKGEVEITSLKVIKGLELVYNTEGKRLKAVSMDKYMGKNRAYYVALMEDSRNGLSHLLLDVAFDTSSEVYVTARPLTKGYTMSSGDFYAVKYKSSKVPVGAITDRQQIEGKILTAPLAQGVLIRDGHLADTLIVRRGQRVNIAIEIEGITLSAQGVLRVDAPLGGPARVYCEATKKELQGMLVSQNMVKVNIQ
jgi:flagella basal body P-ring formation protein FlgA